MGLVFSCGEVQHLTGVSKRRLVYWDQSRVLQPHGRAAQGRGTRRLYTILDVLQIKLICRLRDAGMSLQKIRAMLDCLAGLADEPAPLAELEVLCDGRRAILRRSEDELIDPLARQFVLRFPLAELLAQVQAAVPSPAASEGAVESGGRPSVPVEVTSR
jgi:DNA-binding transcriptional MerR regulator